VRLHDSGIFWASGQYMCGGDGPFKGLCGAQRRAVRGGGVGQRSAVEAQPGMLPAGAHAAPGCLGSLQASACGLPRARAAPEVTQREAAGSADAAPALAATLLEAQPGMRPARGIRGVLHAHVQAGQQAHACIRVQRWHVLQSQLCLKACSQQVRMHSMPVCWPLMPGAAARPRACGAPKDVSWEAAGLADCSRHSLACGQQGFMHCMAAFGPPSQDWWPAVSSQAFAPEDGPCGVAGLADAALAGLPRRSPGAKQAQA
jgi:hypothetical protein